MSRTYTYTKDACMHSNTTSFVVNAFAPPHTQLKSQLKAIMGFSTSSQPQGSSSSARTLRAHRCLLCCHPKELRLIHKLYDHNYWSKLKCSSNINSKDWSNKKNFPDSSKQCQGDQEANSNRLLFSFNTRGSYFHCISAESEWYYWIKKPHFHA